MAALLELAVSRISKCHLVPNPAEEMFNSAKCLAKEHLHVAIIAKDYQSQYCWTLFEQFRPRAVNLLKQHFSDFQISEITLTEVKLSDRGSATLLY